MLSERGENGMHRRLCFSVVYDNISSVRCGLYMIVLLDAMHTEVVVMTPFLVSHSSFA